MSKSKLLLILGFILVVVLLFISGIFMYRKNSQKDSLVEKNQDSTLRTSSEATDTNPLSYKTYESDSGFSFLYPETWQVKSDASADDSYYEKLSIVEGKNEIKVAISDTSHKSIDALLAQDSHFKGAQLRGAINLGGMPAKQYISSNYLYTVAIDQGVLYLIDAPISLNSEVYDKLITSFVFIDSSSTGTNTSGAADAIIESEEVVE